jgi:membrane peptidoglycan carboxypeptidase
MTNRTKKASHQVSPSQLSRSVTKKRASAKSRKRFIKTIWFLLLFLIVIVCSTALGYAIKQVKNTPPLDVQTINNVSATTNIYDRNNKMIGQIQEDGFREPIKSLSELSPYIPKAFIAAEDKNFFTHLGINPISMIRAGIQNILGFKIISGASTITQQVIKNVYFPNQNRTIDRKIQEIILALRLEQKMTKDEILKNYLNWIYFGKSGSTNLYGIRAASQAVFGKQPKDLNLAQAAFIAALPNNPSLYNVSTRLENTITRQRYILNQMKADGLISDSELKEAHHFDIRASIVKEHVYRSTDQPYLLAEIKQRATEALQQAGHYKSFDEAAKVLSQGGFRVYTTIDSELQRTMQNITENPAMFPADISYRVHTNDGKEIYVEHAKEQVGAVLIDNRTGGILAVGAGRDYKSNQNNHTLLPRQPGSLMKPLAVYGPAVEKRLVFPGTVIDDVPTVWNDPSVSSSKYFPFNWDRKFHGLVTVREAFRQSYNIPALKVFEKLTPASGLSYVKRMGITTIQPEDYHLASGIGGMSSGLTVEEATSAYTTFPNQGVWRDSYLIDKIVDRNNHVVYEHKRREQQVFTPQTAYILTDMMRDVVSKGTASVVGNHFPGRSIAGKTGTTNDDKDAWFIGYTPSVTLGIWVGYDIPYPLKINESKRPQILWNAIMDQVDKRISDENSRFAGPPEGIVRVKISRFSGKLPTSLVQELGGVTSDLFVRGSEPSEFDDVLIKLNYVEFGGKKYIVDRKIPLGISKEGIFIKRTPYTLPNNETRYKPLDANMEIPKERLQFDENRFPIELSPFLSDKVSVRGKKNLPNSPSGIHVKPSAIGVSLIWAELPDAKGYTVYRSSDGVTYAPLATVKSSAYNDVSALPGVTYFYKLTTITASGESPPSQAVSITTRNF